MYARLLDLVRAEVSGERALESVRAIARHHRIQSTPGYDAAAAWLAEALRESRLPLEVEIARGDGRTRHLGALLQQGWECTRAVATLRGEQDSESLCDFAREPLSIVQRSAAMSGTFPLVSVGEGTEPSDYHGLDVRGRAVLASGPVHRVHALASERGAAGILTDFRRQLPPVRTEADDPDAIAYTSFWWSERARRGWGFVVSPRVGRELRRRLARGEKLRIEGEIVARSFDTDVPLVTAVLREPPADFGRHEVLVLGHLCHPRPGANDNASGAAAVLECARVLSVLRGRGAWRPRYRGVRFLWMPEWNGTLAWLAADGTRAGLTDAAINLDMVGEDQSQCGSTFQLEHPPHWCASFAEPLVAAIRRDWIAAGPGAAPRIEEVRYSGGSDHAILLDPATGVPCPMLIQWPDRYYHSSLDTPDRCDPRSLAMAAGIAATYAGALAAAGPGELDGLVRLLEADHAVRREEIEERDPGTPSAIKRERERHRRARLSLRRLSRRPGLAGETARAVVHEESAKEAMFHELRVAAYDGRVPVRKLAAPLDLLFHLMPGWDDLPQDRRERWRSLEASIPGGRLSLELAWYACDGLLPVDAIVDMVNVESTRESAEELWPYVETFFDLAADLGIAEWKKS